MLLLGAIVAEMVLLGAVAGLLAWWLATWALG